jgi:RNA recognition motif-containing protein
VFGLASNANKRYQYQLITMMNIYVGNLSRQADEVELKTLFSEYGEVKCVRLITDSLSGESRGFAFVEMEDLSEATLAIRELNGHQHEGRTLKINEAKPRGPKVYNSFSSNYGYKDRHKH